MNSQIHNLVWNYGTHLNDLFFYLYVCSSCTEVCISYYVIFKLRMYVYYMYLHV